MKFRENTSLSEIKVGGKYIVNWSWGKVKVIVLHRINFGDVWECKIIQNINCRNWAIKVGENHSIHSDYFHLKGKKPLYL